MNAKSLYYYIIQESRGTLGGKYKYDDLVDKIIDLFLKKNYHINTTVLKLAGEELLTDDDKRELSKYYPEWLGDIRIQCFDDYNDKSMGKYSQYKAKLVDNKLSFDIRLNLVVAVLKTGKYMRIDTGGEDEYEFVGEPTRYKRLLNNVLHHELKHAFDDWIVKIKNIKPRQDNYHIHIAKIKLSNTNKYWKDLFSAITYAMSNTEMSAHQQEYLNFYKNHPLGKIYIDVLKHKYKTLDNFIEYLKEVSGEEFEGRFANSISNEISKIDPQLATIETYSYFSNRYITLFQKISEAIRIIEVMADHLCDQFVLKECEICYRYIFGKMPKGRFAKDKVLKMLLDFQNKLYIFITKKIYGRVWNE